MNGCRIANENYSTNGYCKTCNNDTYKPQSFILQKDDITFYGKNVCSPQIEYCNLYEYREGKIGCNQCVSDDKNKRISI